MVHGCFLQKLLESLKDIREHLTTESNKRRHNYLLAPTESHSPTYSDQDIPPPAERARGGVLTYGGSRALVPHMKALQSPRIPQPEPFGATGTETKEV